MGKILCYLGFHRVTMDQSRIVEAIKSGTPLFSKEFPKKCLRCGLRSPISAKEA